jgi:cell division protein ZapA (FtsZ GTPase activity inhibitor)
MINIENIMSESAPFYAGVTILTGIGAGKLLKYLKQSLKKSEQRTKESIEKSEQRTEESIEKSEQRTEGINSTG